MVIAHLSVRTSALEMFFKPVMETNLLVMPCLSLWRIIAEKLKSVCCGRNTANQKFCRIPSKTAA